MKKIPKHNFRSILQIEQIAQKAEKRARTRTYTIKHGATGSWLPLWSQGLAVCLSPPCTDEPRIRLGVGDIVRVTRWKRFVSQLFFQYIMYKGEGNSAECLMY